MYEEFEKLIKTDKPTTKEYEVIEEVYATHPAFDVTDAKKKAATLYDLMGYGIFEEMLPLAREAAKAVEEMRLLTNRLNEAKDNYHRISTKYR